ncbi:MAG: magnesium transporter [Acidobacteria bacterium]|nr:magnesium transporter [Acidobacteriota bacterium]
MIHVTELLDSSVYDAQGNYVGRVRELCLVPAEQPSRVARLVIARGKYQPLVARYDQVASVAPGTVRLNTGELQLVPYLPDEAWLTVRKDLLDQQIIDIHGRKVVRVNDLDLAEQPADGRMELRVVQVDVGLAGALRRLLKGVVSPGWIRSLQKRLPTRVIPWEFVDVIETDPLRRVKLKLEHSKLGQLHPADIADIIEALAPAERGAVIEALDASTAAEALGEVKDDLQVRILGELDKGRVADILEQMPPDEAADLLAELPAETATEVLQDMNRQEARELQELLQFEENTAGGLMTPELFACTETTTVAQAAAALRGSEVSVDSLDTVYLIQDDKVLLGAVPVGRLLRAAPETPLGQLRAEQLVFVDTEAREKQVIDLMDKYNLRSLPVVDAEQKLVGVITVDDVLNRLWQARQ